MILANKGKMAARLGGHFHVFTLFLSERQKSVPYAGGAPFLRQKGGERTGSAIHSEWPKVTNGAYWSQGGPTEPAMTWRFALHTRRYEGIRTSPTRKVPRYT